MEMFVTPAQPRKARKSPKDPSKWKRSVQKAERYSPKGLPDFPSCGHFLTKNKKASAFKCMTLTMKDIKEFHSQFYSHPDKIHQDAFILKYIQPSHVKRVRSDKKDGPSKTVSTQFFVRKSGTQNFMLRVCQRTFVQILQVSPFRVKLLSKKFLQSGTLPIEQRGGPRVKEVYLRKRAAVKAFLEKLTCVESHYSRGKSIQRHYVSGDLNLLKLWRMYNNQQPEDELRAKRTFFRKIFEQEYNIGFGSPITDACSKCIELKGKIRRETDAQEKNKLITELAVHKARYKAFYNKLKEEQDDLLIMSFDCQKNLVLPKIQDQSAYYSRQLYIYNLTIVTGSSKSSMTPDNIFCYTWMEHQYRKSSNEISSAVFHLLKYLDLTSQSRIRLCADGCGGQNRNSIMTAMLTYFFCNMSPVNIKSIELVFPITGHSFLPPDRVFALIEKKIRRIPVIIQPSEYHSIFSQHCTVFKLGEDVKVYDWRSFNTTYFKKPSSWHFQLNEAKRFLFQKSLRNNVSISGEPFFNSDIGQFKFVTKKGISLSKVQLPEVIPQGNPVKPAKINDIGQLLIKHFGNEWRDLEECTFYKNIVAHAVVSDNSQLEDECEGHEEDRSMRV